MISLPVAPNSPSRSGCFTGPTMCGGRGGARGGWMARVQVGGCVPERGARIQTLASQSSYDTNDEMRPNAVRPVERRQKLGASFEYTFPRSSVTVIEMTR